MRDVKVALVIGLVLTIVAVLVVLSRSPLTLAGTNAVPAKANVELAHGNVSGCQPVGTLPQGVSAIRIAIEVRAVGPKVSVKLLQGSQILSEGHQDTGWGVAPTVTVPIKRLVHPVEGARICIALGPTVEPVRLHGVLLASPSFAGRRLGGVTLRLEYLRPGPKSWFSLASSIAHHMGLGRAASGTWIAFLALALLLAVAILASRLALEELR
jgi:hypothetical protein